MSVMRLISATSMCLGAMLAIATGAQAAPEWEVKTPGGWHALLPGERETLTSSGTLVLYEVGSNNGAKCKIKDREAIWNEPAGAGGRDLLFPFEGACYGGAIYPCTAGEHFTFSGNERGTRLAPGPEDEILVGAGPWLVLSCPISHLSEAYEEGALLHPALGVNKLTFGGIGSGTLKAGLHKIYFRGTEKLKPAFYKKVR
jgi:hypothetical protein